MASKQLLSRVSTLGRCSPTWVTPLAAVRNSSSRSDIEKVTHTGQVSVVRRSAVWDSRLRKHCYSFVCETKCWVLGLRQERLP